MQILLIGGAGFVGEYLAKELAGKKNYKIVVGYRKNEPGNKIKHVFYEKLGIEEGNLKLEKLVLASDIVVIMTRPEQASIDGLIRALGQSKKLKKIIYLSTLLLYGNSAGPQSEKAGLKPLTSHEKNKYNEEKKLIEFAKKNNCRLCLARLGNVYGDVKNKGIINWIFLAILNNQKLVINGQGDQIRDYIFVEDAAKLLAFLIFYRQKKQKDVFNICSGQASSIKNLIDTAEKIARNKINLNFEPPVMEKKMIVGENKKILKLSGYRVKYDIAEGLKKTYNNYLKKLNKK